ncbi:MULTISPECIES: DUF6975 family protein [Sphingomonas]|uniref:DUF6975 family protein n=1 Tax=Sphingomonas TaxID=13687 RepID=UPI000AD854E2|nr:MULTISPECIES: hypothetical protein [Sphingomonas]
MASVTDPATISLGESVATLVDADGTGNTGWPTALAYPGAPLRDLADAVHNICALHGMAPSIVEQASEAPGPDELRAWLRTTAIAFDEERTLLAALVAAVGPLPSTPGQAQSEATVLAQRHALAMLAVSDRVGCAAGAAAAFLLDWSAIRRILALAGDRVGTRLPPSPLPRASAVIAALAALGDASGTQRAVTFGAQQLLAQHRGLWELLDARASARRGN